MTNVLIDILLSTYNGEKYLVEQINSIIDQTFEGWRLIIRDDGSTDETVKIIRAFQDRFPDRILMICDVKGNLGVCGSFSLLAEHSSARYVAFCDQDDVWQADKLELQFAVIQEFEKGHSVSEPVLIHSDLRVVNEELKCVSESLWKYQKLNPERQKLLSRLIVHNFITGCTVIINRSLLEIAFPVPSGAIMHDWWLALVAVANGKIISMRKDTVLYRQHAGNDTGATYWGAGYIIETLKNGAFGLRKNLQSWRRQAHALIDRRLIDDKGKVIIDAFLEIENKGWFGRRIIMFRYKIFKYGFLRNVAMFMIL